MNAPEAIRCGLKEVLVEEAPEQVEVADREWSAERIQHFIDEYRERKAQEGNRVKASAVIRLLAREMGINYSKPDHGPSIAKHLTSGAVEPLRPTFADLFETTR